ncbi:Fic family protein [Cumulibacter manganitolerans]|uniref:oxidoreductase n=1 Tax=Cumulibacter manganitolerans TaxID=1884992 RepID=UPI0012970875|nr:oxidoreductase [Cumulibacter manganitolerans]
MPTAPATDPLLPLVDLPGVAEACARAREDVDRLLKHRVLRKQSADVSGESLIRGARASAELEDHGYQLEAVRAGTIDDPVVTGCLRVAGGLGRITETWEKAPLQAIAALHLQAARGSLHNDDLGRPVGGPEVSRRLQQLADTVRAPRSRDLPGVVVAAVVHGELLALRPFAALNGVVARGAARVALISTGVDPKALAVPEVGHVAERREYEQALAAYRGGTPEGVARWIVHCAGALSAGAVEGLAICEAVLRG